MTSVQYFRMPKVVCVVLTGALLLMVGVLHVFAYTTIGVYGQSDYLSGAANRGGAAGPEEQVGQRRPGLPGRGEGQRAASGRALPRHRALRGQVRVGRCGHLGQVRIAAVREVGVGLRLTSRADRKVDLGGAVANLYRASGGSIHH